MKRQAGLHGVSWQLTGEELSAHSFQAIYAFEGRVAFRGGEDSSQIHEKMMTKTIYLEQAVREQMFCPRLGRDDTFKPNFDETVSVNLGNIASQQPTTGAGRCLSKEPYRRKGQWSGVYMKSANQLDNDQAD